MSTRYFGFHRDLPPGVAAEMLGGRVTWERRRGQQWIAVVSFDRVENAEGHGPALETGMSRLKGADLLRDRVRLRLFRLCQFDRRL